MTFDELIDDCSPAIQDLARAARDLVLSVQPDVHQEVYPGWGGYLLFKRSATAGNTVCWVSAHQKHVSIGFSQGQELTDPARLLQGKGKNSRHLKLTKAADLARPEVRALVSEAWARQPEAGVLEEALERVRRLCLALPETSETVSHGHPNFWAGKKTFAVYGLYSPSVAFKADGPLHVELEGDPRFFPTPYMAKGGWLSVRLDADTDWQLVERLLRHSYRQVATRKLLAAME